METTQYCARCKETYRYSSAFIEHTGIIPLNDS
jgi:hypothetical protein